jgi:predicted anti-sigma-YlaC factor YlaD
MDMEDKNKNLMDELIEQQLNNLKTLQPTDDVFTATSKQVAELYKIRAEEKQAECESLLKEQQLNAETQQKERQDADSKKDRWIRLGVDIAGIVLPLGFYASWMKRGFKFEETGSITSSTFKGLIQKFSPTK